MVHQAAADSDPLVLHEHELYHRHKYAKALLAPNLRPPQHNVQEQRNSDDYTLLL